MGLNSPAASSVALKRRFLLLSLVAVATFCVLISRLWYLQVIKTGDYSEQTELNRTPYIPIEPPRGSIIDPRPRRLPAGGPATRLG